MKEMKCPECGKNFIPAPLHIYKMNGEVYCSYTCWRKNGGDSGQNFEIIEKPNKIENYHKKARRIIKEFENKSNVSN